MSETMKKAIKNAIKNVYHAVGLIEVRNCNPNGDPDSNNAPRLDAETGIGLISNVCIKHKSRNYVDVVKKGAPGYRIYIKADTYLNDSDREAYDYLGIKESELKKAKKDNSIDVAVRDFMCENWYDIRTFGAVMTTHTHNNLNCGQVRGPVQVTFARSIDPIIPQDIALTRVCATSEKDPKGLGPHTWIVPYALYRFEVYVSAKDAEITGFSEEDLALFWESLMNMFEFDHAMARGEINFRKLVIFKHESEYGNERAYKLFDLVKVEKKDGVDVARSYDDYNISVDIDNLPKGVTCEIRE